LSLTTSDVLTLATPADAAGVAALLTAAANRLSALYGEGHWSRESTERGVLNTMRTSKVFVAKRGAVPIATMTLATKKPWAIDVSHFTPRPRVLYMLSMAVDPDIQRQGVGRTCIDQMLPIAQGWPADTLRLDAYDADAGAGGFYLSCGFTEVGRVVYRNVPLVYFERLF
jgi:GNAT superfamily N-acetyltransferase